MNILFVSAEVAPFVSVGGMSQVLYFLPRELSRMGHDVRIFTPKYGTMESGNREGRSWKMKMSFKGLKVPLVNNATSEQLKTDLKDYIICNVKSYINRKNNIHAYFLENREYYELRANVFGYMDDHIRFALLSRGCLEWLYQIKLNNSGGNEGFDNWWPDIIHCNDWHTAYLLGMGRRDKRYKQMLVKTALILTVHNFAFQGNYDYRFAKKEDVDDGKSDIAPILSKKLQKQNALLRGLLYADAINTVSPTHAIEVLTPEYAEGLDETLQKVKGRLKGILNGLDITEFDPSTDPIIKVNFTEKTFDKARRENKTDLQKLFLLPSNPEVPLLGFAGRLWRQKGLDLLIEVLPYLLAERPEVQVIILGSGDDLYRNQLLDIQKKFPKQLGLHMRADFRLPRKIFAGVDIFLIPSSYEPGGLVALETMRYGAVPLIRRTGGLNDVISEFDPLTHQGTGFSFVNKNRWALYASIIEALTLFKQKNIWKKLVLNCLRANFTWEKSAKEYDKWYKHIIEERRRATRPISHPAYSTPVNV